MSKKQVDKTPFHRAYALKRYPQMVYIVKDTLFYLNSEWQGCESPILAKGSSMLAQELFKDRPFTVIDHHAPENLAKQDGVFALDNIGNRFLETMTLLKKNNPKRIVTVGGSCGTEAAPVAYLNSLYQGDLAVVWFDAHGDLNTPDSSPSNHFHGMVLRTLLGEGPDVFCSNMTRPVMSRQVFLAGVRELDPKEEEYIANSAVNVCNVDEKLASQISASGFSSVYIHIDVDVINPDDFSDALMPAKEGPTFKDMSKCLSAMTRQLNIVGVGIVECCGKNPESLKKIVNMLKESGVINH